MKKEIEYIVSRTGGRKKMMHDEVESLEFEVKKSSVDELVRYIAEGRAFTSSLFNAEQNGTLNRKMKNWHSADMIVIDIDNGPVSYEECLEALTFTPTISYPTFSYDEDTQTYKYRLIYIFEESIVDKTTFKEVYDCLCWQVEWDLSYSNEDNCGRVPNQMFFGTNKSVDYNPTKIYSYIDDLWKIRGHHPNRVNNNPSQMTPMESSYDYSIQMKDDLVHTPDLKSFCSKWWYRGFRPTFQTVIPNECYVDGVACKEDCSFFWGNINLWRTTGRRTILKPGDGRRNKLYTYALYLRKMGLSADAIAYNLANIVANFMVNVVSTTDNRPKFTGKDIWALTEEMMALDPDKIEVAEDKRSVRVSKEYAIEHSLTPQAVLGQYRVKKTNLRIEQNYDITKTDTQNAVKCGCSAKRVAQWRTKVQGISKKQITDAIIEQHYDPSLSLRENAAVISQYTKCSKDRVSQWLKENPATRKAA